MFENISSREKKLLLGVGTLVPISILFLLIFWWIGAIDENNQTLMGLDRQIAEQKDLQLEGKLATRRKNFYSHISLPNSVNDASNDYQRWLKSALTDSGLKLDSITPRDGEAIRNGNRLVGRGKILQVRGSGRLENFNKFLKEFYSLNLLHRIDSLTLIPKTEKANNKIVRSGSLTVIMTIEIMSLKTGKDREDFADLKRDPLRPDEQYATILNRNIFGPANNQPLLDGSSSKTVTEGMAVSFSVSGKDADNQDLLKFEMLESPVEDAKLEQKRESDRRARFTMPNQPPGKYEFKIKISDNGYPSKSTVETFTVNVREKKKTVVAEKKKPDPELDAIKLVRVRAITTGSDGIERAWLEIPRIASTKKLAVNESFEVDEKEYSVVAIDSRQVKISGDDKKFIGVLEHGKTKGRLTEVQ
jgi:hypothetical protein